MPLPYIVKEKLLSFGVKTTDSFLVAVSGGADSTALLLAMHKVFCEKGRLTVAHLDHGIRSGSGEDLDRVVELCSALGISSITGQLDLEELETWRSRFGSLEAGMRQLRYRFLTETARKSGSKWVVTGHTADDQAETVLFRVARGMDWRSLSGIPGKRGMILRPLIDVPRSVTRSFCSSMDITPVMDPSNYDETYARGRIRNRTLPGLVDTFHPAVPELLLRMGRNSARLAKIEGNLLRSATVAFEGSGSPPLGSDLLRAVPQVLRRRVIVEYLLNGLGVYPSGTLLEDTLDFILSGKNGRLSLPGDMILTLSYGLVHLSREGDIHEVGLPSVGLELKIPGNVAIPAAGIALTAEESTLTASGIHPRENTALLSRKKITGPLWVRKRLSGDRFRPFGMQMDKKLKDFLIDRKVPRIDRDRIPIVVDNQGDIVWVGGIEISQKAALDGVPGEEVVLLRLEILFSGDPDIGNGSI